MFDVESANNNFPTSPVRVAQLQSAYENIYQPRLPFVYYDTSEDTLLLILGREEVQTSTKHEKRFSSCSIMFEKRPALPPFETLTSTLRTWRASTNVKMKIAIVFRGEEERVIDTTSRAWNAEWHKKGRTSRRVANKTRWCLLRFGEKGGRQWKVVVRNGHESAPNFFFFFFFTIPRSRSVES